MDLEHLSFPSFQPSTVWLVGAGPGDPTLLTLQALHAINKADVIVYDALVSDEILSLAKNRSQNRKAPPVLEYAGKRGGKPSLAQRAISARLIELARAGNRVCRLKGGDPLIFARGAEEALLLCKNNIPYRIVAGITAAVGGLANAYIPLTHRDINHHVTFLTGHDAKGEVPNINWQAISAAQGVLVFYMGLKNIGNICQKLLEGGRKANEPVAFLSNATTSREQLHISSLEQVAKNGAPMIEVPAIIVVGEVVALREVLYNG